MAQLLWIVTGFCCLLSACQARTVISCRFKGVFHVEKYDRYALNREDAIKLCHELNTTIANLTLMEIAQDIGFETCRYGWIEDRVVIPRIKPNPICAANYTGIFTLGNNDSLRYDAYCYNASETEDKSCEPVLLLNETDLSHKTIDSYDPTLDTQNPFRTQNSDKSGDTVTDPGPAMITPDPGQDWDDIQGTTDPHGDPFSTKGDGSDSTEQTNEPGIDHSGYQEVPGHHFPEGTDHEVNEFDTEHTTTENSHDSDGHYEHPRHHDHQDNTGRDYTRPDDESSKEPDSYPGEVTDSALDPDEEHGDHHDHDGEHGKNPNKGRKTQPGESENDITKQRRAARVPDWLIVLVALVALGLILSVCLAINTRRLCGQKKKLVINGNKTKLEDGEIMEQNGDNIKSQEMVQLVSQEHTVEQENHMTTEDIKRNEKDIDMKIGV
ncbi:CD44 antigen precursor [Xenopus tropicalis]|uniref:CD44 antigen n=1 Tax=Xenopus tropicalis TaxID=8364 RepID=A0A803KIY4_XENTR|nr:CD44 antigen precursor [Xenopus tropicalis]AAH61327.1 CD44 molecule (Indian blood group) [Xenopus tropicalis]|eukprot:NP_988948.1 CD44 antigen precursor [Xenopus tropicalis]